MHSVVSIVPYFLLSLSLSSTHRANTPLIKIPIARQRCLHKKHVEKKVKNKNERNLFKVKQVLAKPGINTHSQETLSTSVLLFLLCCKQHLAVKEKKQTTHEQKTLEIINNLHFG